MQARVFLQPLASANGTYQDEIEISSPNRILGRLNMTQRANRSKWSGGLIFPATSTISCANQDGMFDTSEGANSIFAYAGADRCRVRIEYPTEEGGSTYQTIYRGQITTKESRTDPSSGTARWIARTPDVAFVDQRLNVGLIQNGMTIREAIEAVFTDQNIAAAIPNLNMTGFYDPNILGTVIANEDSLLGSDRYAADVMQKLLRAGDNLMMYSPRLQAALIVRRAELRTPFWLGQDREATDSLGVLNVESGVERVYNQISVTTGVSGNFSTLVESDEGSISRYGLRNLSLDLTWIRDLDQIQVIAKNLLSRLKNPQKLIEVIFPAWGVVNSDTIVGATMFVNLPGIAPRDSSRYGNFRWGHGKYSRAIQRAIQGNFYVEEIERNLAEDVVKVKLRQYIGEIVVGN